LIVLFLAHEADYGTLADRAGRLVQAGRFEEAARCCEQILRRQPDDAFRRFQAAVVCLRAGDEEAYRRHCRVLLDGARGTSDPRDADRAAKVCLLGCDGGPDVGLAAELADRAVRLGAGDPAYRFFQLVRGMAAYRTGKSDEALDWLRKCQKTRDPYSASTALVFEAMALQRLGRPKEAREALSRADALYPELGAGLGGGWWADVLTFQIARQEAGKVVAPPAEGQ
jgi:tetratricopeptide (TPR) repeat protein